jgi:hypothetical protein
MSQPPHDTQPQRPIPPRPQGHVPPRSYGQIPPRPYGQIPPRPYGQIPPRPYGQTQQRPHGQIPPPHYPSHPPAKSRPVRRRRMALTFVCVVAMLVGGAGGVAIGQWVAARPIGPADTPTVTADFPNAKQRHLRGLTVSSLADDWLAETRSWTCEDSDTGAEPASGASTLMGCTPRGATAHDLRVNIEYDGQNQVRAVHGLCVYGPGDLACKKLFTQLAGVLLEGDADLRQQAVDWAGANVDNDDSTVIGHVRLIVNLSPHYLRGTPAG